MDDQPPPPSTELALRREALRHSVRGARASVPMLWLAIAVMLYPAPALGQAWLVAVVAPLMLASGAWRLVFMHRLQRRGLDSEARIAGAERQIQLNAVLSGLAWALCTITLFPLLAPEQAVLHIVVLAGTTAVAAFYMSLIRRAFEAIAWPAMLPLILASLWPRSHTPYPQVAVLAAVYLAAMLRAARHFRQTTRLAMRRGLEMAAANQALQAANQRLAGEAAARERFLATMGHELRRPLAATQGALDLLAQDLAHGGPHPLLSLARQSHAELQAALTDLLEHAELETGQLERRESEVSLPALAEALCAPLRALAGARNLRLVAELDTGLPALVRADARHLERALQHLLSNAVKFTPRGQVVLAMAPDAGRPGAIRFEVRDTGIGIASAQLPLLFRPFQQLDMGPQRAHAGSGLGLAIARRLVRAQGGDIEVRSEPGQGSVFAFSLPLPAVPQALSTAGQRGIAPADSLQGVTVLLAEDDLTIRVVSAEILRRHGATVREAADGQQAIAELHAGGIDLVLMDGQMPVLDGYEATRQWREHERRLGSASVPILAVTANTLPADVQLAYDCGMDDHLAKPYGIDELLRGIARALARSAAPSATALA